MLAGTLFLAGSSRIPAAETALIVALDLVFGPAIVWAVFAEAPTREGLVGGAVVLAAVIGHIVAGARKLTRRGRGAGRGGGRLRSAGRRPGSRRLKLR